MMDGQNNEMHGMTCKCPHHKMIPLSILLIGVVFLLNAFGMLSMNVVSIIWPILVIVIGGTKMAGNSCKCCKV